jgi:hypothetical protein
MWPLAKQVGWSTCGGMGGTEADWELFIRNGLTHRILAVLAALEERLGLRGAS